MIIVPCWCKVKIAIATWIAIEWSYVNITWGFHAIAIHEVMRLWEFPSPTAIHLFISAQIFASLRIWSWLCLLWNMFSQNVAESRWLSEAAQGSSTMDERTANRFGWISKWDLMWWIDGWEAVQFFEWAQGYYCIKWNSSNQFGWISKCGWMWWLNRWEVFGTQRERQGYCMDEMLPVQFG